MGEHCECNYELSGSDEICPNCGLNIRAIHAEKQIEMYKDAIEGWRKAHTKIKQIAINAYAEGWEDNNEMREEPHMNHTFENMWEESETKKALQNE